MKAVGVPENIFVGNNGRNNLVCASGCSFPTDYISKLGKSALGEQKERIKKRQAFSILDDLEEVEEVTPAVPTNRKNPKRRQISFDLLQELG